MIHTNIIFTQHKIVHSYSHKRGQPTHSMHVHYPNEVSSRSESITIIVEDAGLVTTQQMV
jgi:hypothetical protein